MRISVSFDLPCLSHLTFELSDYWENKSRERGQTREHAAFPGALKTCPHRAAETRAQNTWLEVACLEGVLFTHDKKACIELWIFKSKLSSRVRCNKIHELSRLDRRTLPLIVKTVFYQRSFVRIPRPR